jgi:hypothetical protein
MDDEAVIAELVAVKGIGRWTAEMFLMFSLLRPDVLPVDDIGLQRAVEMLYNDGKQLTVTSCADRAGMGAVAIGGDVVPVAQPRAGTGPVLINGVRHIDLARSAITRYPRPAARRVEPATPVQRRCAGAARGRCARRARDRA